MRFKGKKPIFSRKDTWDLSHTLRPVILAGLEKYKEVITEEGSPKGVGHKYLPDGKYSFTEEELAEGHRKFLEDLDIVISAFQQEPEFSETISVGEYTKAYVRYYEKRQEGMKLFGEMFYENLWW
jgi:hypothetical protein